MKFISLLIFLFSLSVFALDQNEELTAGITNIFAPDIARIDRGTDDGVRLNDHVKFYRNGLYIARAVIIHTYNNYSYAKIYRVVDVISEKDKSLLVVGINNSLVPDYIQASIAAQENFPAEMQVAALNVAKVEKINVAPAKVSELKIAEDDARKEPPMILNTRVYASPISKQSLNDAKNINYGFNISNQDRTKYEIEGGYNYNTYSQTDPFLKQKASGSFYSSNNSFDINNIYGNWSYFAMMNFKRQRMGVLYPIKSQIDGGLTGVKYKFFKNQYVSDLSLSYIPVLEYRASEVIEYHFNEETFAYTSNKVTKTTNLLRHSFRFRFRARYMDYELKETFFIKPKQDLANHQAEIKDCDLSNNISFNYYLTQNFQFGYSNQYFYDIRLKRNNNLPSTNMIHTFNLNYNFSI